MSSSFFYFHQKSRALSPGSHCYWGRGRAFCGHEPAVGGGIAPCTPLGQHLQPPGSAAPLGAPAPAPCPPAGSHGHKQPQIHSRAFPGTSQNMASIIKPELQLSKQMNKARLGRIFHFYFVLLVPLPLCLQDYLLALCVKSIRTPRDLEFVPCATGACGPSQSWWWERGVNITTDPHLGLRLKTPPKSQGCQSHLQLSASLAGAAAMETAFITLLLLLHRLLLLLLAEEGAPRSPCAARPHPGAAPRGQRWERGDGERRQAGDEGTDVPWRGRDG